MIIHTHSQGTPEWHAARAGVITASNFKFCRDRLKPAKGETTGKPSSKCIAYAARIAVERVAGKPLEAGYESWQMREGRDQESVARAAYDVETGNVVSEVGLVTTDDGVYGYSSDGFVGEDGLIEVKCLLSPEVILRVIGDGDLSDYMDQCIGGLWLTGRKWIDLCLWAPALEPIGRALTIHHITRNESAIEALEADLMAFAGMVDKFERTLIGAHAEAAVAA